MYVEGDIETRVFNDSINGEVKYVAEICVRRDGMLANILSLSLSWNYYIGYDSLC